ncbi:hypothetical protein [Azospirillum griseum]|uniref:hypothetical protein n=1 Tax=Azospirillum griseum TaxID=2496639 RepID=UPI001FEA2AAD|nr:hypothetical protein [Azospirillum griseum]
MSLPLPRIALFTADLTDRPDRRALVALAHALADLGHPVDLVAPMGGGSLRAGLDPAIGQIDLCNRWAATSAFALARCVAERRPAVLAVPVSVAWVARLAVRLARSPARILTIAADAALDDSLSAIRDAARQSG